MLWVITPLTSGNESLQLMDLLLHGDRSSVKRVEGLNSTKTDALEFFKGLFVVEAYLWTKSSRIFGLEIYLDSLKHS